MHIDLLPSALQVVYGENEKGKSTIKSFITTVLFGFPMKSQVGAHYEPKQGTNYGGKLFLETKDLGEVTIERQKGKNGGKAIVYFADGSIGGEDTLHQLLGGMDKSLFTGIFSFSASDLQKIEQLKSDELNRYLQGASILGKGSLIELEKKLEKNQQELFKPSGKKPILNEKLQRLEDIRHKLREVEGQLSQYDELLSQRKNLSYQQIDVDKDINRIKEEIRVLEILKIMKPLYFKEKGIVAQLEQLPSVNDFPLHAVDQVKDSLAKEQTLREQINELEGKLVEYKMRLKDIALRPNFDQLKEQSLLINEKSFEYGKLKEELSNIELEIRKVEQLITDQTERLGKDWNNDLILQTQTSLTAKEELKKLAKRERKVHYEREQLEVELKTKSMQQEQTKRTIQEILSQCLSDDDEHRLEQQMLKVKEDITRRKEIEQNINWLNIQSKDSINKNKNSWLFKWIALFFLGVSGWLISTQQWIPALLSIISAIFMIIVGSNTKKSENNQLPQKIKEYKKKLDQLQTTLELEREMDRIDHIVNENVARKNQLDLWIKQSSQEENGYRLLLQEFEICENEKELIHNQITEWCNKYQFVHYGNCEHLLELFGLIVEVKQNINHKNYYENRKIEIVENLNEIEELGRNIAAELEIDEHVSLSVLVHKIAEIVEMEQKSRFEYNEGQKNINMIELELDALKQKTHYLKDERSKWMMKAKVKNEEQFFYYAKVAIDRQALEKELLLLRSQQAQVKPDQFTLEQVKGLLDQDNTSILDPLKTLTEQLKQAEVQQSTLQNKLGRIEQEIEQLETEESYSQLRQTYEIKTDEFQAVAKEWATVRISQLILSKAKSIYETERQPVVIQKAKELFSLMTNGEYVNLIAPVSENAFIVERYDGMRFSPDELSQGTGEQLYLSLRLSLALAYQAPSPMPIILDDIMVNFDDERKQNTKYVIEQVAENHQILFFTCHQQIKDLFHQELTMVLS